MNGWQRIGDDGETIIYVPFEKSGRSARLERRLPSGTKLVTDHDSGVAARTEVRERFDWKTLTGLGRELNDEEIDTRFKRGDAYVVVWYQDFYDHEGCVTRSQLRLVEEHAERRVTRREEFQHDVDAPEHLRGTIVVEHQFDES